MRHCRASTRRSQVGSLPSLVWSKRVGQGVLSLGQLPCGGAGAGSALWGGAGAGASASDLVCGFVFFSHIYSRLCE